MNSWNNDDEFKKKFQIGFLQNHNELNSCRIPDEFPSNSRQTPTNFNEFPLIPRNSQRFPTNSLVHILFQGVTPQEIHTDLI